MPAEFCDATTIPPALGPTDPSYWKCMCRKNHLLKTFWDGWTDRQFPDGTVEWTSPTGKTYLTHPGSRLLFPRWKSRRLPCRRPRDTRPVTRTHADDAHPTTNTSTKPRPPNQPRTRTE